MQQVLQNNTKINCFTLLVMYNYCCYHKYVHCCCFCHITSSDCTSEQLKLHIHIFPYRQRATALLLQTYFLLAHSILISNHEFPSLTTQNIEREIKFNFPFTQRICTPIIIKKEPCKFYAKMRKQAKNAHTALIFLDRQVHFRGQTNQL